MNESQRFRAAIERFDAANAEDPNVETHAGKPYPKELLYSQRMTKALDALEPSASEAIQLAVRAQHICRWKIPRNDYAKGRDGYRKWRTELGRFHAETAGKILRETGYDATTIERVQAILRKERLKADPDAQLLEDAACLVFLEHYAAEFVQEHAEPKLINIFRRTWSKMSPRGQKAALQLDLPGPVRAIVGKALDPANRSR
ncbi:MAG: DUF4202 domain-containing protein [Bryobacterales bacterium]